MATVIQESPATPAGEGAASVVVAPAARRYVRPFTTATPRVGWRYVATDKRDLRLDLLRGFAVFAMVIDHIGGSSWLYALSGGNRFFVSAAEAFVFISGLTVGLVYGERLRRDGLRSVTGKLLARAWTLYVLAVWLAIGTAFFAAIFNLPRSVNLTANPARFIIEVITLQRTYYLVDVMLLYALLLLVAPLALVLLRRGLWWVVLIASCALWGAYQAFPQAVIIPWKIVDNPVFNFAPWQFLFFVGLLIGYGREWLARNLLAHLPRSPLRDGWLTLPLLLCAGLIYLHATNAIILAPFVAAGDTAAWLDFWFDKSALPLPRLVACAIIFGTAWLVVTRCWVPLRMLCGRLLLPLGQRALYAYAAHLFLIVVIQVAILTAWGHGREVGYSTLHPGLDALIQIAGIAVLWALTQVRFLQNIVAPLGNAPFVGQWWRWRRWAMPRPADSLSAMLIVALLCGLVLLPGRFGTPVVGGGATPLPPSVAGGVAPPVASSPPVSTVTIPRRVAGNVRGSSGLTGRSDELTPTPGTGVATIPAAVAPTQARLAARATSVAATPGAAKLPSGGYLKDGEFYSRALGRTMPYGIYIPPTYGSNPTVRYPVLYMLHGAGGHYSEWVAYGLPEKAEDLFWAGQIQPMIIVMPQGDQSYWANHTDTDAERWGDYIAYDLVAHIDATYRTLPKAASRAVGGLSMGGFGALQLAFNHPDVFGTVGGHSPALHNYSQLSDIFPDEDTFGGVDPLILARQLSPTNAPHIWVDTGADDIWADRVTLLARELDERGIAHEIRVLPGHHDADYWTSSTGDYLRFYSRSVVGGEAPPR